MHFEPFTVHHIVETVQILVFTFIAFWLFRKKLTPHADISLDVDWLYRRPASYLRKIFVEGTASLFEKTTLVIMGWIGRTVSFSRNPHALLDRGRDDSAYSPDRYRPLVQTLISILLAAFIMLVLLGLF